MRKLNPITLSILLASLAALAFLLYQWPPINRRLSWRLDFAMTYVRGSDQPGATHAHSLTAAAGAGDSPGRPDAHPHSPADSNRHPTGAQPHTAAFTHPDP